MKSNVLFTLVLAWMVSAPGLRCIYIKESVQAGECYFCCFEDDVRFDNLSEGNGRGEMFAK